MSPRRGARVVLLLLLVLAMALPIAQARVEAAPGAVVVQRPSPSPAPSPDPDQYIPIVPPDTISGFLTETKTISDFLANLPVEEDVVHDVLDKILDVLVVHLGDAISAILKSFGIDFHVDLGQFSFKWLLNLLHFYSYNQDVQTKLIETWTQSVPTEQEEWLKRLYLTQVATKTGFECAQRMADDAAEGLYDLIDLILGSTKVIDHIGDGLSHIPLAGELIAKIKVMIAQRVVYAFQSAVELATAPMSEPNRSRIRAVATALATTYIKWKDLQVQDGFGGIPVELITKVGFGVMGKTLLLMGPKIGLVSITQAANTQGALMAQQGEVSGTFDQAKVRLLDDGNDTTETGFTEMVQKTTIKKSKLSRYERMTANVAGAISQIAQLYGMIDPSSVTKIVAIVAGVLAGGLQVHSIFNSIHYFYQIPRDLKAAVPAAFHPDQANVQPPDPLPLYRQLTAAQRSVYKTRIREAHIRFSGALEEAAEAANQPDPELLYAAVERLDGTSRELTSRVASLDVFQRQLVTGPGMISDPVHAALLDHHLKMGAVQCATLAALAASHRDPKAIRAYRDALQALDESTRRAVEGVQSVVDLGMVETTASLALESHGAIRNDQMITLKATISNVGNSPAKDVTVRLALAEGFRSNSSAELRLGQLAAGQEKTLSWTVVGKLPNKKRGCFAVLASSQEGLWASRFIYVSK